MKNYANEEINYSGCPGCAYANHEFSIPCGMAFEDESFTLSQDWELPIEGFFIASPKRHIEKLVELTDEERNEMFDIVNKTIKVLRDNNVCDRFDIIFEEKENRHLHVWIMPRHKWMMDLVDDIIDNVGTVLEYAKNNFRTPEVYERINEVSKIVEYNFKEYGRKHGI